MSAGDVTVYASKRWNAAVVVGKTERDDDRASFARID